MIQDYLAKLVRAAATPDRVIVKIDTSVHGWRGLSRGKQPSDFDPKELRHGTKVELEHVKNKSVAQRIAMDHLTEDTRYYQKLAKFHHAGSIMPAYRSPRAPSPKAQARSSRKSGRGIVIPADWKPSKRREPTWEEKCLERYTKRGLTQRQAFWECLQDLQASRKATYSATKRRSPEETKRIGRPPKHWMKRCMASIAAPKGLVRSETVKLHGGPGALCGWVWYHQMSDARRAEVLAEAKRLERKGKKARPAEQLTLSMHP